VQHQREQQKQPQEEFNFEVANARFSKEKLVEEVSHVVPEAKTELPPPAIASGISSVYNRQSSFFDSLSCETLERTAKQEDRRPMKHNNQEQRRLDSETFGSSSLRSHGMGGHSRGRRYHHGNRGGHSRQPQKDNKPEVSVRT